MIVARNREELARALRGLRGGGGGLALVPTMGSLHGGHLSLLDRASELAESVAVSIFVNPLQFSPAEDFERYPRSEERDLTLLEERGVKVAFVPPVEEMYPPGHPSLTVDPGPLGEVLCGPFRPGHFRGVLTVVAKLFGLFRPEIAVFGRKDFQQGVLVRRMAADLEQQVEIVLAPIVRELDGLAMSSRNEYLSPAERAAALGLFRGLEAARASFEQGERDPEGLLSHTRAALDGHALERIDYVEVIDPQTLGPVERAEPGTVVAVAAWAGGTRLIDNAELG